MTNHHIRLPPASPDRGASPNARGPWGGHFDNARLRQIKVDFGLMNAEVKVSMANRSGEARSEGTVLSVLAKRKALHARERSAEELAEIGRSLVAAEHYSDALDFLAKAGKTDEIESLRQKSLEFGDLFLYEASCRLMQKDPVAADLVRLGDRAHESGKLHFARKAYRLAGSEAKAEAVERDLASLVEPTSPPPAEASTEMDMDVDE
jgi:hypothetical protein